MDITSSISTSNSLFDINTFIEKSVENKINQFFDVLPNVDNVKIPKMVFDYTLSEIYNKTIKTTIDIINDILHLLSYKNNENNIIREIYQILMKNDRKFFVGIIFIIFSFILYFIDGADV